MRKPDISNTDQGTGFTRTGFTSILENNNIAISMDGKGRALDNIMVKRLWRSVKYEGVYIKGYESVRDTIVSLNQYLIVYNSEQIHQFWGEKD